MPFTGFQSKAPTYEVITPHTHKSYKVRSLTVSEEERLKGSFTTPGKVTEHLNRCLYEAIVERPKDISDFETWQKMTTLKDRETLVYGLYHITYDEDRDYDIGCGSCGHPYAVTVKASSTFNFKPYPADDVLNKRITIELPTTTGVSCTVKQPTVWDEANAVRELASSPEFSIDNITDTLIIDSFEETFEGGDTKVYDDRGDIIDAFTSLPSKDRRKIFKSWDEAFGDYGIELKMKTVCPSCKKDEVININLVSQFFRAIHEY